MFHVKHRVAMILVHLVLLPALALTQGAYSLPDEPFHHESPRDSSAYQFLARSPYFKNLSRQEQEFFQWVNIFRSNPSGFRDRYIKPFLEQFPDIQGSETRSLLEDLDLAQTLEPLVPDPVLLRTTRAHALDLSKSAHVLNHNSSNGTSFKARMEMAGIRKCAGENLYDGKNDPIVALIILLVDKGIPNAGHRKALMRPDFRKMGVSIVSWKADPVYVILVQDFSCD
jgi:hypothetical protein